MEKVSSRRGRPRSTRTYRSAQIAVAMTVMEMGRIGGNLPRLRALRANASKPSPGRMGRKLPPEFKDADLAALLPIGSDAPGIQRLASGRRAILPATAASCVLRLIETGRLPRRALSPIALDSGHARAMKPFIPLMTQLLRVKLGSPPPPYLMQKVQKLAALHRTALLDFGEVEKKERGCFRKARRELRGALLNLRDAELSSAAGADPSAYASVAKAAKAVQEALDSRVVSLWHVCTPRYLAREAVRQVMPPFGPDGVPQLERWASWIETRLTGGPVEFRSALHLVRDLVTKRWNEDPFDTAPANVDQDPADSRRQVGPEEQPFESQSFPVDAHQDRGGTMGQAPWDRDESLIAGDPWLGPLYGRLDEDASEGFVHWLDDDRFVRRVLRSVDPAKLGAMVLFQFLEHWYFEDDCGDSPESDFSDRLSALQVWAARLADAGAVGAHERVPHADGRPVRNGETAATPSWCDIRALLRDLARIEVRPWIEMNLDLPDALPLEQQWWNAPKVATDLQCTF